jgi:hypothetical protein
LSSDLVVLNGDIDLESLEVDDEQEHQDGGHQVGEVGKVVSQDSLLEGVDLITSDEEGVEESDDGSFVLETALSLVGDG